MLFEQEFDPDAQEKKIARKGNSRRVNRETALPIMSALGQKQTYVVQKGMWRVNYLHEAPPPKTVPEIAHERPAKSCRRTFLERAAGSEEFARLGKRRGQTAPGRVTWS